MLVGSDISDYNRDESNVVELGRTTSLVRWEVSKRDDCDERIPAELELGDRSVD